MVTDKKSKTSERSLTELKEDNQQLEIELQHVEKSTKQLKETVDDMEQKLSTLQKSRLTKWLNPTEIKQALRNAVAYALGRRNIKRLYSSTYKRKQASNDLLPYIRLLYEEGFTKKALADLQKIYETTTNNYLKRAIAYELALYYANKETKRGAIIALTYIRIAKDRERDNDIRRQLCIIEAECYIRLK